MKTVAFYTLGCKVNQYETQAMSEMFERAGYKVNKFEEKSDIYVINTCTVTGTGDKKSRQIIRRAKSQNYESIIVVVGCYSQTAPEDVKKIAGVDIILGNSRKHEIVSLLEQYIEGEKEGPVSYVEDISKKCEYEDIYVNNYAEKTRAFVKIEDGCNEFCSYCIIPYARGRIRSRSIESIVSEIKELTKRGFKEVVLTGIHLASYGKESKDLTLKDAIDAVNCIDGIERIRLGSLEPRVLDEEFIEHISKMPKMCNHFHISLQSGCDDTLKRMNRKYTSKEFYDSVLMLRKYFDNPAITTDIIVGFPGETEEEFQKTCEYAKTIKFSEAHIFAYSNRQGTVADKMPDQVEKKVKEERSRKLISICDGLHKDYMESLKGKTYKVLFEQKTDSGMWEGHMTNYVKVCVNSEKDLQGNIIDVEITDIQGDICIGKINATF